MKKLLLIGTFIFALAAMAAEGSIEVGMPEAKLIELKGAPQTKAAMGKKSIYRWSDMQVILTDGKVAEVQYRDRVTEKQNAAARASAEERKQAAAKAEAKQAAADAKRSSAAAKRSAAKAEDAQDSRLLRIVYLQEQVRGLERELEADAKRSSFKGPPPMSSEARAFLNLRLEKTRAEIAQLK